MKNIVTKQELNTYLERLNAAVENDIEAIKKFDQSDIIRLEKSMLLNLRYLKKYDAIILKIDRELASMYEKEARLTNQINYTKSIIIDASEYTITKSILVLTVYAIISSNNLNEFIKKLIILLAIDALTFNINADYFSSDKRKELVKKRLDKLKTNITVKEINYLLYKGINKCFTLKLDTQYDKLMELYPEVESVIEKKKIRRRK